MKTKPENIGEFFKQSLEDFEVKEQGSDWPALGLKLERLKFFTFSLTYFNIYYASIIALTFVFTSALIIDHFLISGNDIEVVKMNEVEQVQKDGTYVTEKKTEYPSKENINSKNKESKSTKSLQEEGISDNKNISLISDSVAAILADSVKVLSIPTENKEGIKKIPKKRIIYITKQDTIIVIDTVKTKNRKILR